MKIIFAIYLCFFLTSTGLSKDDPRQLDFEKYLKDQKKPIEYVKDVLEKKQLLMIGEDHWIVNHPRFLKKIINEIGPIKNSPLDVIAIEFGTSDQQKLADKMVNEEKFNKEYAYDILRNGPDNWGWPYHAWLEVFEAIWKVNKVRKDPLRLVLTDTPWIRKDKSKLKDFLSEPQLFIIQNRDINMYYTVRKEILDKGLKGIYYAGLGHTLYETNKSKYKDNYLYRPKAGKYLKMNFPDQVHSVKLWSPSITVKGYYPTHDHKDWGRHAYGWVDQSFKNNGNKPVGFDIKGTSLGKMTNWEFFPFSKELEKKWGNGPIPEIAMENLLDGYIFVEPIENFQGDKIIEEMFTPTFLQQISSRRSLKETTAKKEIEYIKKIRPILN